MPGRILYSDYEAMARGFVGHECQRRRDVLRETIKAFQEADPKDVYHRLAKRNLARWHDETTESTEGLRIEVLPGDWGEVTRSMTAKYGECFAVLNMANAFVPGGAYVDGAAAQEENMFRRTDCHFRVDDEEYDPAIDRYRRDTTRLLLAKDGRVYLDTTRPRVCIRGSEDRSRPDLGYAWLSAEDVFPFYELRAAAQDLRGGQPFSEDEARRRILAQFDTLRAHKVRHVVFGAFGCGAFKNPGDRVAAFYREAIKACSTELSVVVFAIFNAGYGPDNFPTFADAMRGFKTR